MTSTYDQLINEGMEKCLAEGREPGRAQGLAEGKVDSLLKLLEKRFGDLPTDVIARVRSADVQQLDDWVLRFVDTRTLDDVFAQD